MKSVRLFSAFLLLGVGVSCSKATLHGVDPNGKDTAGLKLVLESPAVMDLDLEEAALIRVRVLYRDDTPAANKDVVFAMVGPSAGSSLLVEHARSGQDGRVQNQIAAGADKTTFEVAISVGDVIERVTVNVDGDYSGSLRVRFQYTGLVSLGEITARVHPGVVQCAAVDFANPPDSLADIIVNGSASTPVFQGLTEGEVYTVTAVARNASGADVAAGCAQSPEIRGRTTVTAYVPLNLNSQSFVGTYDFGTRLHADEALPGDVGAAINDLNEFFLDPANVLAQEIINYASAELGWSSSTVEAALSAAWLFLALDQGLVADADGDGKYVDDALTYYVLDRMPGWAQNGILAGGDLTEMVKNLTVGGKMEIETADDQGNIEGHWSWADFVLQWRAGQDCEFTNICCGRRTFGASEMGLGIVGADFTGTVTARNVAGAIEYDFVVGQHKLEVEIGTIVMFALENMVLPSVTGESSIAGAAESLFGCQNGANPGDPQICGCDRAGLWIDSQLGTNGTGANICKTAIDTVAVILEDQILALSWAGTSDSYFMMGINGVLADRDKDLQTDELVGTTAAELFIGADSSDFSGDITADIERVVCGADNACESMESCQVHVDVLDVCSARQICAPKVGTRVAGQACSSDAQCTSGTCLGTGSAARCLSVCEDAQDCPGSLTCNATTMDLSPTVTVPVNACGANISG